LTIRLGALDRIAARKQWPAEREKTLAAARAIYLRLPDGYKLWSVDKEFVPANGAQVARIIGAAA
jgi:hypothetical protein